VCTTELGQAKLKPEFDKGKQDHGLSIDPVSDHKQMGHEIKETSRRVNYPMSATPTCQSEIYDIPSNASDGSARADNATIRSVS